MRKESKPIIETIINTSALALTSFAVVTLTTNTDGWISIVKGLVLLSTGMSLEFLKYVGRKKKLW